MSQEMKIKDEQLKSLQEKVGAIQQLQGQIGGLFIQAVKSVVVEFFQSEEGLRQLQKALQDEYGKVSINIQDGTYQNIEEEETVGPEILKKA